jgi:hypothetical protein
LAARTRAKTGTPPASRLLALGFLCAATLVSAGWRTQTSDVEHALLPRQLPLELWRDPADGEVALRWQGSSDWTLLRGRTRFDLIEGHLNRLVVYVTGATAWKPIHEEYGVTEAEVDAALDAGDHVQRPSLMNVPNLDRPSHPYYFVRDFGSDVGMLRRAARFPVPAPGPILAGLRLWC